jgi:hypothetical protein
MTPEARSQALKDYLDAKIRDRYATATGNNPEADEMAQACAHDVHVTLVDVLLKIRELEAER